MICMLIPEAEVLTMSEAFPCHIYQSVRTFWEIGLSPFSIYTRWFHCSHADRSIASAQCKAATDSDGIAYLNSTVAPAAVPSRITPAVERYVCVYTDDRDPPESAVGRSSQSA